VCVRPILIVDQSVGVVVDVNGFPLSGSDGDGMVTMRLLFIQDSLIPTEVFYGFHCYLLKA
jgi:hypothetical protein